MSNKLQWKIHLPRLLSETIPGNTMDGSGGVLRQPLNILIGIMRELTERAIKINDPELNIIMCRLALYEESDPFSDNYDPEIINKLKKSIKEGEG